MSKNSQEILKKIDVVNLNRRNPKNKYKYK